MRKIVLITFFVFVIMTILVAILARDTKLYSRRVMTLAETLVSHDMTFSPVTAANTYAGVAKIYYEVLQDTNDSRLATLASVHFLRGIYDEVEYKEYIERFLISSNFPPTELPEKVLQKVKVVEKAYQDKKPWLLDKSLAEQIPIPPKINSQEMNEAVQNSIVLTNERTLEQSALINFWSGMHMTPSIAGIWQGRLYDMTKVYYLSDKEYAYAQYVLATALADTLNEVWKVKFKYNAPRPSKLSKEINLSMQDPPYPSYVSEYSATAEVAGKVLTTLFPRTQKIVERDVKNIQQMGLWAGCTFSFDEKQGEKLGELVFVELDKKLNLQRMSVWGFIPLELFTRKVGVYQRSY